MENNKIISKQVDASKLYTISAYSKEFELNRGTIYNRIWKGKLETVNIHGMLLIISEPPKEDQD